MAASKEAQSRIINKSKCFIGFTYLITHILHSTNLDKISEL